MPIQQKSGECALKAKQTSKIKNPKTHVHVTSKSLKDATVHLVSASQSWRHKIFTAAGACHGVLCQRQVAVFLSRNPHWKHKNKTTVKHGVDVASLTQNELLHYTRKLDTQVAWRHAFLQGFFFFFLLWVPGHNKPLFHWHLFLNFCNHKSPRPWLIIRKCHQILHQLSWQ